MVLSHLIGKLHYGPWHVAGCYSNDRRAASQPPQSISAYNSLTESGREHIEYNFVTRFHSLFFLSVKGSPYSITERRVPELIPVLGSQPAGDMSHKPDGRLPLLSARPAVTPATIKRAATNFAAWWTEAQWVWTVCQRLLLDSVAAAIWTGALLRLSPAC